MLTLKEHDAIDYLEASKRTMVNLGKVSGLEKNCGIILQSMVDLELLHLRQACENPTIRSLAQITIAEHGFPELSSWLTDIADFFEQYAQMRNRRANLIAPLVRAFSDGEVDSMTQESLLLAQNLNTNRILTHAIQPLIPHQYEFFRALNRLSNKFPVFHSPHRKGMLEIAPNRASFKTSRHESGSFKFVPGSKDANVIRLPYLLCEIDPRNSYQILIDSNSHDQSAVEQTFNLATLDHESLSQSYMNLAWGTDFTTLSDKEINCFLTAIATAKKIIVENIKLWDTIVDPGADANPDSIQTQALDIAKRAENLYHSIENPVLRVSLKQLVAKEIDSQRRKIEAIALNQPDKLIISNPLKKALLVSTNPFRNMWRNLLNY